MGPGALLEIDWEVGVFRGVRALWRRLFPEVLPYDSSRAALLSLHERQLTLLARLVASGPVSLSPARSSGGIRGKSLLVPAFIDEAPDEAANRGLLLLRVVHTAAMWRLLEGKPPPGDDTQRWIASLRAVTEAAEALSEEMPLFRAAWSEWRRETRARRPDITTLRGKARAAEQIQQEMLEGREPWREPGRFVGLRAEDAPQVALWGLWIPSLAEDKTTGLSPDAERRSPEGAEVEAPAIEEIRRVMLDPKEQEEKVLIHSFEKVETLDSWEGNVQNDDGSDNLEDHLEALSEVDLRDLIRGGSEAQSLLKADLDLGADVPDVEQIAPGERGIPYDEWDHRARRYRKGWCTVYPTPLRLRATGAGAAAAARNRSRIEQLEQQLSSYRSARAPVTRQLDGEDPDIDAMIDDLAARKAGLPGSDRLYIREIRERRDFATTVLLDVSLSSDSWVSDRRVLDVSREAIAVLGEVTDTLGDRLRVLAFSSSTRNRCRVFDIKGWSESWVSARDRLYAVEPQGYTRIGPALRHATHDLAQVRADKRLLILVSDSKPNDYDRYEGSYGIADVRMAVREASARGISLRSLAIDKGASAWLPSMFGPACARVLPSPDAIVTALTEIYGRSTAR